jgi:hypothetical protein
MYKEVFMKKTATVAIIAILLLVALLPKEEEVHAGFWTTASSVQFTHYWPWYEPHYGAYFSGSNGSSQYFTGSSGQPSGYGSWDWWGTRSHVLLLSKSWLFAQACLTWDNNVTTCGDRWTGSSHHALMQ